MRPTPLLLFPSQIFKSNFRFDVYRVLLFSERALFLLIACTDPSNKIPASNFSYQIWCINPASVVLHKIEYDRKLLLSLRRISVATLFSAVCASNFIIKRYINTATQLTDSINLYDCGVKTAPIMDHQIEEFTTCSSPYLRQMRAPQNCIQFHQTLKAGAPHLSMFCRKGSPGFGPEIKILASLVAVKGPRYFPNMAEP